MKNLDFILQDNISLIRTEGLTQFLFLLTTIFDFSLHFILISFCVSALIYLFRDIKYAVLFLFPIFTGAVLVYILKELFDVSRPLGGIVVETSKSFPSGHATISTVFFVMLMYIFDDYFSGAKKYFFNFLCVLMIFLVSFSRLYLGVHWLSDVVFGVFLGCLVSYISVKLFRRLIEA